MHWKKRANVKRQKLKSGNHELVSQATFNWFLNMQSQNVPLPASMTQEKEGYFYQRIEHWKLSGFR